MTDIVDKTLHEWRRTRFEWGVRDCLLSIADYALSITGEDWGAEFRDTYRDRAGALAHIKAAGGERSLIDRARFPAVSRPIRGDIILARLGAYNIAGICTGAGGAFRMENGVREIELKYLDILHVWRVL